MSCSFYGFFDVISFMESSIIKNQNAIFWKSWNEILCKPGIKDICRNGCFPKTTRENSVVDECANDIRPSGDLTPVLYIITPCSFLTVPPFPFCLSLKPAFIDIDNTPASYYFFSPESFQEPLPLFWICPWVGKGFFLTVIPSLRIALPIAQALTS